MYITGLIGSVFNGMYALTSSFGGKKNEGIITLPKLDKIPVDERIYSQENDFLSIPVDKDLTAYQPYSVSFLPLMDETLDLSKATVELFKHSDGRQVKCIFPLTEDTVKQHTPEEKQEMINQAGRALKSLSNHCIIHKEGWWTYELCHMRRLRQYHQYTVNDKAAAIKQGIPPKEIGRVTSEYLLGRYLPNAPEAQSIKHGATFVMLYKDGDSCLTPDKGVVSRSTEIRFKCSPHKLAHFIDVYEDTICHYVVVIGTPALCSIPLFDDWHLHPKSIICVDPKFGEPIQEPTVKTENKKSRQLWLNKINELVEGGGDSFPLLKRAIWDLLESEFGALETALASHQPRQSLYDVFSDLKQKQSSDKNNKPSRQGKIIITSFERDTGDHEDTTDDEEMKRKLKKTVRRVNM